ncbi:MAG: glutamate--tRNA ligase family protein [Candidatus Nasuia deltocephalinicola]
MKTRFAPEANWNLHIGHLKSLIKNIEISKILNGRINIRIDDTNSKKNKKKYKNSIIKNINLINKINEIKFNKKLLFTSKNFFKLYQYIELIKKKSKKKNK